MKKKSITLFFLASNKKNVKKLHFSKRKLNFIFFFCALALLLLSFILFDYANLKHQSFNNANLRTENNLLYKQLEEFQMKMTGIEETLKRNNNFATKIRIMTKFEDPDRLNRLAIGPISQREYEKMVSDRSLATVLENLSGDVDIESSRGGLTQIDRKLNMLSKAAFLQEHDLGQLQELLEDQKSILNSIPAIKPVDGWLTSGFGPRISPFNGLKIFHEGMDIAASTGTIIIAPADGLVTFSGVKPGYGNTIVIDHGYGYMTKYGHNSVHFVKAGDKVKRGDRIATVGNTGRSTGPHLHYEVQVNGLPRNPKDFILD